MRGSEFLRGLETAFPGITARFYQNVELGHDADEVCASTWSPVAAAAGAKLTPEVMAKHRRSLGIRAFRQHRRQNGAAPPPEPPAAEDQLLPLEGGSPVSDNGGVPRDVTGLVAAAVKAELAGVVARFETMLRNRGRA
jgi:hypothetical protein